MVQTTRSINGIKDLLIGSIYTKNITKSGIKVRTMLNKIGVGLEKSLYLW